MKKEPFPRARFFKEDEVLRHRCIGPLHDGRNEGFRRESGGKGEWKRASPSVGMATVFTAAVS